MNKENDHPVLLYDGECNFCRACVRWAVRHDSNATMRYAALQSPTGQRLLRERGLPPDYVESVALIDGDELLLKSDAVARLFRYCDSGWRLLGGIRFFPKMLRDFGYKMVSHNRSGLSKALGTIDHRWEPPPELQYRFLDDRT